jgi:predicted transcriptional regulator
MSKSKTEHLTFRCSAELKEKIAQLAAQENRTISNWLENEILKILKNHFSK